jgi:DNA repair photolyase
MNRQEFYAKGVLRKNFFERLEKDIAKWKGPKVQVLLCFTSDPYQPIESETRATRLTIEMLHDAGFSVCVLTKAPAFAFIRDRGLFTERDAIATTLTFSRASIIESQKFEPYAESPMIRELALKEFFKMGIPTWVSLEPVIGPEQTKAIIRETHEFVGIYKIGKLNYVKSDVDWERFANEVVELCEKLGAPYLVKKSLQKYLPGLEYEHAL